MENGTSEVVVKNVRLYHEDDGSVYIGKPGLAFKIELGNENVHRVPKAFIHSSNWNGKNSNSDITISRWLAVEKGFDFDE